MPSTRIRYTYDEPGAPVDACPGDIIGGRLVVAVVARPELGWLEVETTPDPERVAYYQQAQTFYHFGLEPSEAIAMAGDPPPANIRVH